MVTALSIKSGCIFDKGTGITLGEEKPEKGEEKDFTFFSFFSR